MPSRSFLVLLTAGICVAAVVMLFTLNQQSQTTRNEKAEETIEQPSFATTTESFKEDAPSQREIIEENVTPTSPVVDNTKLPIEQPQEIATAPEPVAQEPSPVVNSSGTRLATSGERVSMKQAVHDFLDVIETGTREEIKAAIGYETATSDHKKEFDEMSDEEMRSAMDFMAMILEDVPYALDTPNKYTTNVTPQLNNVYKVEIMDGKDRESSLESYELYFKVTGGKWVMSPL